MVRKISTIYFKNFWTEFCSSVPCHQKVVHFKNQFRVFGWRMDRNEKNGLRFLIRVFLTADRKRPNRRVREMIVILRLDSTDPVTDRNTWKPELFSTGPVIDRSDRISYEQDPLWTGSVTDQQWFWWTIFRRFCAIFWKFDQEFAMVILSRWYLRWTLCKCVSVIQQI